MYARRTAAISDYLKIPVDAFNRFVLVENFKQRPGLNAVNIIDPGADSASDLAITQAANKDFEVLGTNATTALATFNSAGGITLTTAGASADQMIVLPHLDTVQTQWTSTLWATAQKPALATRIVTGANITNATIWAGFKLTNTSVIATDDNQVMFRYSDTVGANWSLVYSVSGTDYTVDLGVAVAVSTSYLLALETDADRIVRAYINGVYRGKTTALTSANLIPYIGVQADAAAAKAITIKALACGRD